MWRIGIGLAAGTMILVNGYLHGLRTNRWQRPHEMESSIAKLERVPMTIGDWQARSERLDEAAVTIAGIEGYILRHYDNRLTGKTVTVLLMCGRSGPLSVHTPDVCYGGVGYAQNGSIAKESQKYRDPSVAEFYSGMFSKADVTGAAHLRIKWSWAAEGAWLAPADPRMDLARYSALYKMYVVQRVSALSQQADEEIGADFLKLLLPALDKALFEVK
jgi:Protein of unknown function (DUF3485)